MQKNKYWILFKTTFVLSAFTFGGGYVIIPLMKKKFVEELEWIKEDEMMDLLSIAQSSPGSLAVNASILVGYRMKGLSGALFTVLATITPPLFIISFVSLFYEVFTSNPLILKVLAGMNIGIATILIDVVMTLGKRVIIDYKYYSIIIILAVLYASFKNVNIIIIVLVGGLLGLFYFSFVFRQKLFREKTGEKIDEWITFIILLIFQDWFVYNRRRHCFTTVNWNNYSKTKCLDYLWRVFSLSNNFRNDARTNRC